ncbi:MAG: LacI family DNA-binding transcriptional regulator [Planctomycetes bacterium]|nr:LacI family DNA-binding transcriptional regulator [Planctomycetota bacterium]
MSVNMQQIADLCGLSRQTVGFILTGNKAHLFRPDTRKKVIKAARQLGYKPHSGAQAMAGKRFNAIGLLCGQWEGTSYVHHSLLQGICNALKERDMHLSVAFLPDEQIINEDNRPKFLSHKMIDGLILNYTHSTPEGMESLLKSSSMPCAWLNIKQKYNSIYPDEYGACFSLTRNLIESGHKTIMYYDCVKDNNPDNKNLHYSVHDRLAGYTAVMAKEGYKPFTFSDSSLEKALCHAQKEGKSGARPVIITYGLVQAIKFFGLLEHNGVSVPDEAAIYTFNLNPLNDPDVDKKIGTISIPQSEMGRIAVETICDLMKRKKNRFNSIPVQFDPAILNQI